MNSLDDGEKTAATLVANPLPDKTKILFICYILTIGGDIDCGKDDIIPTLCSLCSSLHTKRGL